MSSCCRLHIHLPMDVVLPEGPGVSVSGHVEKDAGPGEGESDKSSRPMEEMNESRGEREHVERNPRSEGTATMSRSKSASGRKPRTKGLVKKLQEQIEFYFGDANLPKDKFLQQKMKEDPERYVEVGVIASFKKMKALTTDKSLILKAVQNSSLVELSEDKRSLRRVSVLPSLSSSDVDSRTIYVENLSTEGTDHDSVKNMFKLFGNVTYVSLPKHKVSGQVKGFAFIEYSTEEEAKAALEYFASKDKPPRSRKASDVSKKGSTIEENKDDGGTREGDERGAGEEPGGAAMEEVEDTKKGEKREREEDDDDNSVGQPLAKKMKPDSSKEPGLVSDEKEQKVANEQQPSSIASAKKQSCEDNRESEVSMSESSFLKTSRLESQSSETDLDLTVGEDKGEPKKKKNRQHKKKHWASILRDLNLRVMSKSDWLEMKKVYRDLQKAHMKQLKTEMSSRPAVEDVASKRKGFVADCLLKVSCSSDGGADIGKLKEFCSRFGEVAYMDIENEDKEGYIRYRGSGCVAMVLQSEGLPGVLFSGVEEEDERAYYLKSQAQRKQKFIKRGRSARGRDRLISKVLRNQESAAASDRSNNMASKKVDKKDKDSSREPKHIRFSDSDSS